MDRTDHPRGCGEHALVSYPVLCHGGSSPRMRGAHEQFWPVRQVGGIIPADAGSTSCDHDTDYHTKDHPRGCGEHWYCNAVLVEERGSSPRMRGAPTHPGRRDNPQRIIPADAGSTAFTFIRYSFLGDHPRGCGEHIRDGRISVGTPGSSPRMRGAPFWSARTWFRLRIIPADAGST